MKQTGATQKGHIPQFRPCPNCASAHVDSFYQVKSAPIFSMVTLKSKDQSFNVPRREIELGFCKTCGFIFNRAFEPSTNYFTLGYEDQQGFSHTYTQYIQAISRRLIEKYNLKGGTFLEIGCGKGDFINTLTELSGGRGIGIDPAYEMGRQSSTKLQFYNEFFSAEHGAIPCDLICCRHTLEHIQQTAEFLRLIRLSIPNNRKPVIFFEVPDVLRILDIAAFWDIYYEHCSYFSPGSLAYLFRITGFEILDLRFEYNSQYLVIEALPSDKPSQRPFDKKEDIADLESRIEHFNNEMGSKLNQWQRKLRELKHKSKKTVLWGGGSKAVGFLTNFAREHAVEYVVDINPNMENNFIPGFGSQYVQPHFLKNFKPDVVIIMNDIYKDEISNSLKSMGLTPELYSL